MLIGEFGIGSTNNPVIDIFVLSQHFSAWSHICISHTLELGVNISVA